MWTDSETVFEIWFNISKVVEFKNMQFAPFFSRCFNERNGSDVIFQHRKTSIEPNFKT